MEETTFEEVFWVLNRGKFGHYKHSTPHKWGWEYWLVNNDLYCAKLLELVAPKIRSSLHYHEKKDETFIILDGKVVLEVHGENHLLATGDSIRLCPKVQHRFWSVSKNSLILEVSTHHDDDDTVRLEEAFVPKNNNCLPAQDGNNQWYDILLSDTLNQAIAAYKEAKNDE